MRKHLTIPRVLLGVILLVLAAAATGVNIWYSQERELLSPGAQVAGAEVGGLTPEQAKARVIQRLDYRTQPISVRVDGETVRVRPATLGASTDIESAITEAETASRRGLLARMKSHLGEEASPVRVDAPVVIKHEQLKQWVKRLAKRHRVEPREAELETGYTLTVKEGRSGQAIKQKRLRMDLIAVLRETPPASPATENVSSTSKSAITDTDADADAEATPADDVTAQMLTLRPEATDRQDLARRYPTFVTVSQDRFTLRLYENLKVSQTFKIATGQSEYPTPDGLFEVTNKAIDPVWTVPNSPWAGELQGQTVKGGIAENPLKARWLGLVDGIGIHGTDETQSLGTRASHGCLRMSVPDVKELYSLVPVGTPVLIT